MAAHTFRVDGALSHDSDDGIEDLLAVFLRDWQRGGTDGNGENDASQMTVAHLYRHT